MKKILLPWFIGSLFMFGLSYCWHGVLLNDLINPTYPIGLLLVLLTIVYLGIGLGITILIKYIEFKSNRIAKRMLLGGVVGFFIYLIAFTFGVTFKSGRVEYIVVDFTWQMIEQGIGAFIISFVMGIQKLRERIIKFQNIENQ